MVRVCVCPTGENSADRVFRLRNSLLPLQTGLLVGPWFCGWRGQARDVGVLAGSRREIQSPRWSMDDDTWDGVVWTEQVCSMW
jgi:hypothetical protein